MDKISKMVRFFLGLQIFSLSLAIISMFLIPSETGLGIFKISPSRLIVTDIFVLLLVFLLFLYKKKIWSPIYIENLSNKFQAKIVESGYLLSVILFLNLKS